MTDFTMELPGYASLRIHDDDKTSMEGPRKRHNDVCCLELNASWGCGGDEGRASTWLTRDEIRTLSEKLKEFL